MVHILRHRTVAWLAALLLAAIAPAHAQQPQWRDFLRRDEIEAVELSPNGHFLALAQRTAAHLLALAEDSEAAAEARVAAVAAQTWDRRVDDVLATVTQALARR